MISLYDDLKSWLRVLKNCLSCKDGKKNEGVVGIKC